MIYYEAGESVILMPFSLFIKQKTKLTTKQKNADIVLHLDLYKDCV